MKLKKKRKTSVLSVTSERPRKEKLYRPCYTGSKSRVTAVFRSMSGLEGVNWFFVTRCYTGSKSRVTAMIRLLLRTVRFCNAGMKKDQEPLHVKAKNNYQEFVNNYKRLYANFWNPRYRIESRLLTRAIQLLHGFLNPRYTV